MQLGEVTVANGSVKRLALEGSAALPTVSPKGDKLAYSSIFRGSNIWRRDLLHPETPAVELYPFLAGTVRRSILSGRKAHCLRVCAIWRAGSLDQQ